MTYQPSHHRTAAATSPRPPLDAADLDAFLVEDEFDDALDREIASLRESLADFRND
jgi:hypothetical protein